MSTGRRDYNAKGAIMWADVWKDEDHGGPLGEIAQCEFGCGTPAPYRYGVKAYECTPCREDDYSPHAHGVYDYDFHYENYVNGPHS